MRKIHCQRFDNWPYAQALCWMDEAQKRVEKDPKLIMIACGSHSGRIVTLGRKNSLQRLELKELEKISDLNIFKLERGGGITAHEYGQIVLYPVLNLKEYNLSIINLINLSEETMMQFASYLGLTSNRSSQGAGVYINREKVGFIGMRIKDHISSHGFAINVFNDAHIFTRFSPCDLPNLAVTSLHRHLCIKHDLSFCLKKISSIFIAHLSEILSA